MTQNEYRSGSNRRSDKPLIKYEYPALARPDVRLSCIPVMRGIEYLRNLLYNAKVLYSYSGMRSEFRLNPPIYGIGQVHHFPGASFPRRFEPKVGTCAISRCFRCTGAKISSFGGSPLRMGALVLFQYSAYYGEMGGYRLFF